MRRSLAAFVFALLAASGVFVPAAIPAASAAVPVNPKVVLIVGATHEATANYRSYMDSAYAEARKYTTNVVKIYSPSATWAKVQAAVAGASIVVYMGHGNGWPSPYTYDPAYTTKDGFGLNYDLNKDGKLSDYELKYYGEPSIRTLTFAPNAVVLLHHLCYASGNSEPGDPQPSISVAKQRADNYASAFIRAGARAVIADARGGAEYYIRSLFTTRQTVDQMWRAAPTVRGHTFSWSSARSPGYGVEQDPDTATSGFYRSLTGRFSLRTEDVTGARYAATDADPAAFVVPGSASVSNPAGAGLYPDAALTPAEGTGAAPLTLPTNTRLRILAEVLPAPASGRVFQVDGIDAPAAGYVRAADLRPRDSQGPQVWELDLGSGAFSPNGDHRQDSIAFNGRFSESVTWQLTVRSGGTTLFETSATGSSIAAAWNGMSGSTVVADGTYSWSLSAVDAWGNTPATKSGTLVVDTVAPALSEPALAAAAVAPTFSPNGDGKVDTQAFGFTSSEAGSIEATVRNASTTPVRTLSAATASGSGSVTWDGRTTSGAIAPDGHYIVDLAPVDLAGNVGAAGRRSVDLYAPLSSVRSSVNVFYPQDGDRLSKYATLAFNLARPATVTWRLTTLSGKVVYTRYNGAGLVAGAYSFRWYGTTNANVRLPAGRYLSVVSATNGAVGIVQTAAVEMNAFAITASDTTPARRQSITITAISAESLKAAPVVTVSQPGIGAWSVRMVKVSGLTYRITIRLKSSWAGKVGLRISGYDVDGHWQRTYLALPLS